MSDAALPKLGTRGLTAGYLILFAGEAASKACVLAAFAYLAHVLTPAEYGIVELALSITLFFVLSTESGMGLYGTSVIAAHPERLQRLVPHVMLLRVVIGVPMFAALLGGAHYLAPAVFNVLTVSGIAVLLTPFLVQWVFQGVGQMQYVAAGSAIRNLSFVLLVLILVRPGVDLRRVALAEVCAVAALGLFNAWVLFGRMRIRLDWGRWLDGTRDLFGRVWFMGFGDLTWACIWYSPAVIVNWLAQPEQVAWIGSSVRVVVALHTFVWLYFFNLLPNLARELATGVAEWRVLVTRSLAISLWPAFLVAIGGTLGAPFLMPMVFGPEYVAAVLPLQIAVWMIPIAWFSGHFRFSLIAAGQQRAEVIISAASAAVAVTGALALTPRLGAAGAAVALVAAGLLNLVLAFVASERRIASLPFAASVTPPAIVATAAIAVGYLAGLAAGAFVGTVAGCVLFVAFAVRHNNELVQGWRRLFAA